MLDDDLDQAIAQLNPDGLFFCKLFCKNPNLSTLEAKTAHTKTVNKNYSNIFVSDKTGLFKPI